MCLFAAISELDNYLKRQSEAIPSIVNRQSSFTNRRPAINPVVAPVGFLA
jgi:hypothetical protein